LRRSGAADGRPRRQEGRHPSPAHRRGRLRGDRSGHPRALGRARMTGDRDASLARFSVFALLAVMLPAVVLAVLAYVSLRQWQASAEQLFREQARAMAVMAAEKIRMVLGQREDEVVSRLRGLVERPGFRPDGLDRLLAAEPLVGQLYLFDRRGRLLFATADAGHRDAT